MMKNRIRGREISKNQGSELVIHGKDGKIQQKDSHGKDPNPPKDKDTHKKIKILLAYMIITFVYKEFLIKKLRLNI